MNASMSISPSLLSQLGTIAANGIRGRHDREPPEPTERPIFHEQSRQSSLTNSVVDLRRGDPRRSWYLLAALSYWSALRFRCEILAKIFGAAGRRVFRPILPLADDLPKVFRSDGCQAGDDGDDQHQLDGMQQPRKQYEQEPDDDEGENELHGARLPSPLIQRGIFFRRGGQSSSAGPDRTARELTLGRRGIGRASRPSRGGRSMSDGSGRRTRPVERSQRGADWSYASGSLPAPVGGA
jgi:hypothetical protein